jgi:hypothetical protein
MSVTSGIAQFMKSAFNIDAEQMQQAVVGFQTVMTEIQQHLLAIEKELGEQRIILNRLDNRFGGIDDHETRQNRRRPDDGFGGESREIGNGQTSRV